MVMSVFHHMDRLRRRSGQWLEAAGIAPVQQPHSCVFEQTGVRLLHYEEGGGRGALLIVPAPIKRHYIWDLAPEASVVRQGIERQFDVFLAEWTEAPDDYGLAQYASLIDRCVSQVLSRNSARPHLLTHSLGGALCVVHAALHPQRLASLVLIETPLDFGAGGAGAFTGMLLDGPPAEEIAVRFGSIPGSFLSSVSVTAAPGEFSLQRYADFAASAWNPEDLRTHLLVERWTLDEFAMPGRLYTETVDGLYRQNKLMRGKLHVDGARITPAEIGLPLVAVFNPGGKVIPAQSIIPFYERVASAEKLLIPYDGDVGVALQHVGALVGRRAHARLWPAIFSWLRALGTER